MNQSTTIDDAIERAAELIADSEAILIGAGAGIGVDSGLPDFRGNEGFWNAYPVFRGHIFSEMSNPIWFRSDPKLAWGFYGHRLKLYRETMPHAGFDVLLKWTRQKSKGGFVFTSNVDGQFQKAGFTEEAILECHGSILYFQCAQVCCQEIWPAGEFEISIDMETMNATSELPKCKKCEGIARPNILMFGDFDWQPFRSQTQEQHYREWLKTVSTKKLAAIEFGAGEAVPTVRNECDQIGSRLIRVNPRDTEVPEGAISIPLGALEAIRRIDVLLNS